MYKRQGYYKILGGGIDAGETNEVALAREVREEAGLLVVPESIREMCIRDSLY